jgi:RNA polymerase sigma-70 factor (ECF subfamily)
MASDKALLTRAQQLEEAALAEIYDRFSGPLYAYAYRQLGSQQLAEDFVAETFERFLKALQGGGGPDDHLQAYLYRITHNLITDHYRRDPPPPLALEEDRVPQEKNQPARVVEQREQADRIRRALHLLTDEQRQVVVLRFLEGWSTREVARTLGKSRGAVRAQQHRALASLERILSKGDLTQESHGDTASKP